MTLEQIIGRLAHITCVSVWDADSLWACMEEVRVAYEQGHPLIPVRELLAYRIVRKLAVQDKWGGEAMNKAFLWQEDLPKGGFPSGLDDRRDILAVADMLEKSGVLSIKRSKSETKYALGPKSVVQPILDTQSFPEALNLRKYFERDHRRVSARLLNAN